MYRRLLPVRRLHLHETQRGAEAGAVDDLRHNIKHA